MSQYTILVDLEAVMLVVLFSTYNWIAEFAAIVYIWSLVSPSSKALLRFCWTTYVPLMHLHSLDWWHISVLKLNKWRQRHRSLLLCLLPKSSTKCRRLCIWKNPLIYRLTPKFCFMGGLGWVLTPLHSLLIHGYLILAAYVKVTPVLDHLPYMFPFSILRWKFRTVWIFLLKSFAHWPSDRTPA